MCFFLCQGDILKTAATLQAMRTNEVGSLKTANIFHVNIEILIIILLIALYRVTYECFVDVGSGS